MKANHFSSAKIFDLITQFYYLLLKSITVSEPFAIIMIFLSCAQNLSFIISASFFIKVISDDLSQIIYKVLSMFRPLYIINTLALPSLYKFMLSISMIYMLFYLVIIILIIYKDLQKSTRIPFLMRIFKRLSYMNFYLWYIPLNELLLTPVYCVFITDQDSAQELFSRNLCIGGTLDVILAFFGVFFYGMMMITCLMNVLFFVDMTYNVHNALAKSDSLMEMYAFLSKNLLIILLIFLKYLQKPIFFLAFLIFLEINHILSFREFIKKPNFFNPRIEKFYGLTLFLELYIFSYVLLFTVLNVLGGDPNTGLGLLLTILLPFRFFLNNFQNQYLKNLALSLDSIDSPPLIDKKLKMLFIYLKSQEAKKAQNPKKKRKFNIHYNKNESRILFVFGYLYTHLRACANKLCFCHNEEEKLSDYSLKYDYRIKENPVKNLESLIYLKYFIRQQYKDAISMMKTNLGLRLNLAYFNFFQLNNYHQALLEAFELNDAIIHLKGLNYRSLFLIKRLELEIRDLLDNLNLNHTNDKELSKFNIEALLNLEINYSKLEAKIAEFRNLYTKFFFKLSNISIKLQELEADCSVLFVLRTEIQNIFEEHLKTNPRAIKLYLGYLNNLVFKNDQGYALERQLKDFLEKIHAFEGQSKLFYQESLIYNENSMIFQVGGEYKNLGKILKTNQGSGKILGYQIQELELSNINIILSFKLKRFHDSFLNSFMKTGKTEKLYKEQFGFVRKKNGYIISTAFLVKPFFNTLLNEFRFLGFMRPLKRATEYLITDMYGGIEGMTENLSKLFNVHPEDYEKSAFYIQILCPKLYSFFIERDEKVHNIFLGSQNSSATNRTNRTSKFKEIQDLDLMELLDLPKTLSNEAILRFYRYNDGELFVDLRSIINAIIDKMRKKKLEEVNPETPTKSSGMDKWNLVKRKFIKIAMMGNFFNCKTKINYYKSSDNAYEWLIFSITEIEFTRKLKIMQMTNKGGGGIDMNNSMRMSGVGVGTSVMNSRPSDQYDPNKFNANFPSILNNFKTATAPTPILMNFNRNNVNNNPDKPNQFTTFSNANSQAQAERMAYQKKVSIAYDPQNGQTLRNEQQKVQYIKEFAQTGIEKIVIHPEVNEGDEQENLLIPSEGDLDMENLVQERVSVPVEEVRKGLDSNKRKTTMSPRKKMYNKTLTGRSTLKDMKDSNNNSKIMSSNWGKTFESMNSSSDFPINNLAIPHLSLEINPFVEIKPFTEAIPNLNILVDIEEEEDKIAENIINFTGNQLFEDKSDDQTDMSVKMESNSRRKSIKSPTSKLKHRAVGFRARFNEGSNEATKEPASPVKNGTSPKFKIAADKLEANQGGAVNKEDLKVISKTLKDISRGLTRGVDEMDDDSDRKTVKSTKIGARTIKTIKSMNKRTNVNVTFTPKTHKLIDILRETIVKKLALEDDGKQKEKAYEQSVHSSISSIYQSHRLTEKAILAEYMPNCYKRLSWSLLMLMVAIFTLQISIYLIVVALYDGFRVNLSENVNYDRFSNSLLQTLKGIFMYRTLQNQSDFANKVYFQNYLDFMINTEFKVLSGLIYHIQVNYDFYHGVSSDFFTRKSLFNLTKKSNGFELFPFDIVKAVDLYISETQKMLFGQEYNSIFLLENIFGFTEQLAYYDNFDIRRSELIVTNKLAILIILIVISVVIAGIFFIRIHSHIICYDYMNFLLEMLAKTNFEDIETLKTYYISIASVYDLQQELKGPGNPNQMLGINYMENPGAMKGNDANKNRSHRLMDLGYLKKPTFQIVFLNCLLALFIIGINLIVVLLSHGFDSHFEDSGALQKQLITQFNFKGYSNGYVLTYDRSLSFGLYNMSGTQLMDYLTKTLPNNSLNEKSYQYQNSFVNYYLEIITNEEVCAKMTSNKTLLARCEGILNGLLLKSLINFELETFQRLKLLVLDQNNVSYFNDFNGYLELGEGLDYALNLVDIVRDEFIQSESSSFDSEIKTLIIINCVSICFSFFMMTGYYFLSLRKLAKRLISMRRVFIQIPIAILMRQKRVKKYLQDTSNFYLGG